MKDLIKKLEANGIKVVNNRISKADLERAIQVVADYPSSDVQAAFTQTILSALPFEIKMRYPADHLPQGLLHFLRINEEESIAIKVTWGGEGKLGFVKASDDSFRSTIYDITNNKLNKAGIEKLCNHIKSRPLYDEKYVMEYV